VPVGIPGHFKRLLRLPPDAGQTNTERFGNVGRCDLAQLTLCHKDAPHYWDQMTDGIWQSTDFRSWISDSNSKVKKQNISSIFNFFQFRIDRIDFIDLPFPK
jgi:hypothetical protein